MRVSLFVMAAAALALLAAPVSAENVTQDFIEGNPGLESAGPLAFGPDGVLFVGDSKGAAIVAIATGETTAKSETGPFELERIDQKIADLLGTTTEDVRVNDLAVGPSGAAFLSVSRGQGAEEVPLLLRASRSGAITEVPLDGVRYSKAELPNAPDPGAMRRGRSLRQLAITDIVYQDGQVYVAGLSNEEFASKLRVIPFPFTGVEAGTSVEIYHGNHGAWETRSPIRTLVPYDIASDPHILAAYTCTPLVTFPVKAVTGGGGKVTGTTVAELGNRNRPLDMVVYQKDGKDYLLMANSSRGVMKVATEGIGSAKGITSEVEGVAGLSYETIAHLEGVQQLDRLDKEHALILKEAGGGLDLTAVPLP